MLIKRGWGLLEHFSATLREKVSLLYIKKNENLPILTSCCPGWVKFLEHQFPELTYMPSTAKSPQQMFGAIAKSYYCEKTGIKPEDLIVVSVMPCLAKKYEAARPEFTRDGVRDVDIVLTTRELAEMFHEAGIQFDKLEDSEYDSPLGEGTGAATIFGTSGGVLEAALRTAADILSGKDETIPVLPRPGHWLLRVVAGVTRKLQNLRKLLLQHLMSFMV